MHIKKHTNITTLLALGLLALSLSGCEVKIGNTASMPADAELQSLIKTTTSDFADAVEKWDFTKFHNTVSTDLQKQVSAEKFNSAFATFIEKKEVIAPPLKEASKTSATFSPAPVLRTENGTPVVDMAGSFPTSPEVNFESTYEHESSGNWKLLKINYKM